MVAGPVSYTHLDVYKRQGSYLFGEQVHLDICTEQFILVVQFGICPVSYTHLAGKQSAEACPYIRVS